MSKQSVLAADIGGTKILAARVSATGELLQTLEAPTNAQQGGQQLLQTLQQLLQQLHTPDCRAIGLSMAGVIDPHTADILDATPAIPGWKGCQPAAQLAAFQLPIRARNDVHAALLGEQWLGGLRGARQGLMLTLGTGLGGAWLAEGRLQTGANQLAGHVGRQRLQHAGRGWSVDELVSGQGLAQLHRLAGGRTRNGREVLAALQAGDAAAQQALHSWVQLLAQLLHNLHWVLDPGRVLLGGGLIDARALWWPLLQAELGSLPLRVEPAQLGSRAGLLGAARLAWKALP